jgi:hypothetical protein
MKSFLFSRWFRRRPHKAVPVEEWAQVIQRSSEAEQTVEPLETPLSRLEKVVREKLAQSR